MKKSVFTTRDVFSSSPFMSILPVLSSVSELETMTNSMYARYEKVLLNRKKLVEGSEEYLNLKIEENMLRNILEWLSVSLEGFDEAN